MHNIRMYEAGELKEVIDQAVPDYQNRLTEGEEEEEQGVTSQPTTDFLEYDFLGDGHLQDYPGLNTNQICFC